MGHLLKAFFLQPLQGLLAIVCRFHLGVLAGGLAISTRTFARKVRCTTSSRVACTTSSNNWARSIARLAR